MSLIHQKQLGKTAWIELKQRLFCEYHNKTRAAGAYVSNSGYTFDLGKMCEAEAVQCENKSMGAD